jgi:hypothetical protein
MGEDIEYLIYVKLERFVLVFISTKARVDFFARLSFKHLIPASRNL